MANNLKQGCLEIFRESFQGVQKGNNYTWYVQGDEAIFNAIQSLSPEQASTHFPGARATIGAHIYHLCYYLHLFNVSNRGEEEKSDWDGSWKVQEFDDSSWRDVATRTQREFEEALIWYEDQTRNDDDIDSPQVAVYTIANIAHAAYHLGAIRALIPMLQLTE